MLQLLLMTLVFLLFKVDFFTSTESITPILSDTKTVDQDTVKRNTIQKNLRKISLPPGFQITLYAMVPNARHMAVGKGDVVFVGTRNNKLWVVKDHDKDGYSDEVRQFESGFSFRIPNGVCLDAEDTLYVVELNRVLAFLQPETSYDPSDRPFKIIVPQGKLIPPSEQAYNHGARVCRVGRDNKLYIALGQPYNVPPQRKMRLYNRWGIGGIIRMNLDGTSREVYAYGIRNSVGMDFNPMNGELWFTDNQVDGMGDDIPPGEINRITKKGQNFGFPWYGGGTIRTLPYIRQTPPQGLIFPEVEMDAHAADLGMTFYTGQNFPQKYRGGIFNAQHGSWDRTTPIGARVMFTSVLAEGGAGETVVFAQGWLDQKTGWYWGRPVDVAQLHDGSLLVSDDRAGVLYRISYTGF